MIWQTDYCAVRNLQVFWSDLHTCADQLAHLFVKVFQVDNHTIAHYVDNFWAENAGWHQVQDKFAEVIDNGVTSVVSALIANNIIVLGKKVNHSSLSLVSPVDTNNCT